MTGVTWLEWVKAITWVVLVLGGLVWLVVMQVQLLIVGFPYVLLSYLLVALCYWWVKRISPP